MPTPNNSTSGRTASVPTPQHVPTRKLWSVTSPSPANRNVSPPSLSLMRTKPPNRPPRSTVSSSPLSPITHNPPPLSSLVPSSHVDFPFARIFASMICLAVSLALRPLMPPPPFLALLSFFVYFVRIVSEHRLRRAPPSGIFKCVTSFFCRNICKSRLFFVPLHQNTRIALRDTHNIN